MSDPFTQALHDFHFNEMQGPLLYRRGEETEEVNIDFYFESIDGDGSWLESWIDGPLLDLGAGAGRHSLYFQNQFETVAIEQNDKLVEILRDRGVTDARQADVFGLPGVFESNRFQSAIALGTQVGLSRSVEGLKQFLNDLSTVTTRDATAVIDGFDPEHPKTKTKLDYYEDAPEGLAYRVLQMEYDGSLGKPWLYRLFTPDRMREVISDTEWEVAGEEHGQEHIYLLPLRKR